MILGYSHTFLKSHKTLLHNQSNRNLWHNCKRNSKLNKTNSTDLQAVAPCIIGGEYPVTGFLHSKETTEKNKEGGNLQPSKQQEKEQH